MVLIGNKITFLPHSVSPSAPMRHPRSLFLEFPSICSVFPVLVDTCTHIFFSHDLIEKLLRNCLLILSIIEITIIALRFKISLEMTEY